MEKDKQSHFNARPQIKELEIDLESLSSEFGFSHAQALKIQAQEAFAANFNSNLYDLFDIASVAKVVLSTAILKLVSSGKLHFEDEVLPGVTLKNLIEYKISVSEGEYVLFRKFVLEQEYDLELLWNKIALLPIIETDKSFYSNLPYLILSVFLQRKFSKPLSHIIKDAIDEFDLDIIYSAENITTAHPNTENGEIFDPTARACLQNNVETLHGGFFTNSKLIHNIAKLYLSPEKHFSPQIAKEIKKAGELAGALEQETYILGFFVANKKGSGIPELAENKLLFKTGYGGCFIAVAPQTGQAAVLLTDMGKTQHKAEDFSSKKEKLYQKTLESMFSAD